MNLVERSPENHAIFQDQFTKVGNAGGLIAALDQSGGSTPKTLAEYGVNESARRAEEEMFDMIHAMRTRIMTSPSFSGDRILGVMLVEETMEREVEDRPTSHYLWQDKNVVPFLKVDKGLADEEDGVQVMKSIPELDDLLVHAVGLDVFGTKMRSVIKSANRGGNQCVVGKQLEVVQPSFGVPLVPIIEPVRAISEGV